MSSRLPDPPPGILLPIGIFDADYETSREYTLTLGDEGPGNFGWLSWTESRQRSDMETSVCTPEQPGLRLPGLVRRGHG